MIRLIINIPINIKMSDPYHRFPMGSEVRGTRIPGSATKCQKTLQKEEIRRMVADNLPSAVRTLNSP